MFYHLMILCALSIILTISFITMINHCTIIKKTRTIVSIIDSVLSSQDESGQGHIS